MSILIFFKKISLLIIFSKIPKILILNFGQNVRKIFRHFNSRINDTQKLLIFLGLIRLRSGTVVAKPLFYYFG